jgi:hypothetical protein
MLALLTIGDVEVVVFTYEPAGHMQVVLSREAARLYVAQATQALLPVLGAAEPSGQGWQAVGEEVGAALNVPVGQSLQPVWDRRG